MKNKELFTYTLNNSVRHMDLLPTKAKFGFTLAEVLNLRFRNEFGMT